MELSVTVLFFFISGIAGQSHGPVFFLEPPSQLVFSNTTGSQVSCSAHGSPTPQVHWLLQDGQTVTAVPGLRQSLGNGTLYFPPFRAEDYRKDVHSTIYRCRASNLLGTIISRDVRIRAECSIYEMEVGTLNNTKLINLVKDNRTVVNQHYEIQVYHGHVAVGNTAVLGCVIPGFVKEHVSVTSWSKDDSILLPGTNMGGRIVVTYGLGELHIRSARVEDAISKYSCITLHSLTQERKKSAPAMLTVTEPSRSVAPRIAPSVQTTVSGDIETDIHLACSAQGNPPPKFSWFREINGLLQPLHASPRFEPTQDLLLIKRLKSEDSGRWTCKVSNDVGEKRLDIYLTVTAFLSVHVLPHIQVINSGDSATFNCTVSGSPVGQIQWLKNGETLPTDGNDKIKFLNPLILFIRDVTRLDGGMYQCVVRNERESAQGCAELRLGDIVPEFQYTFTHQAIRPMPEVSLKCSVTGSPPPEFRWYLDGQPLSDIELGQRYAISQYVDRSGDVIGYLNISNVRVDDGGRYSCRAINSLGFSEHSARLNVYGPPFIRSIGPVKAVAGADVTLYCPYSGYPIVSVKWERNNHEVVQDLRHRFDAEDSLIISQLDATTDSGFYSCSVTSSKGETARREIQLIVHSPPRLEPFTFPTNLQEGGRAQVTCYITSGDMPIHFSWYKDGDTISASLQVEERAAEFYSMLVFKEVSSRHSGSYTCAASNSATKANYTAQLMVKVSPQWVIEPHNISALLGRSLLVECLAKGFPEPQITWFKEQGKASSDYQPVLSLHSRITLMANGSMWFESVGPQDEGLYLCRAANGIGSGLGKVIYVGVNEPARFDMLSKNISVKRGNPVTLTCQVTGDLPLAIRWIHNANMMNVDNYRYTISHTKLDKGLKSQVTINIADRDDTGIYKCVADNAFGTSEHIIYLAVQEKPDRPSLLEVVEVSSRLISLTWKRPFDGNSPLIGYLIQYQVMSSNRQTDWKEPYAFNLTVPPNDKAGSDDSFLESTVITGLQPATVYAIQILAVNGIDQSSFNEPIIVKTQEEEPSEAPKYVKIEAIGPGELFLTWSVPPRDTWNGELLGYIVSWSESEDLSNTTKRMTVNGWATNKLQLTNLKKFTRYDINVRAFNGLSAGPASATVVGTTKEGVPEAPPRNIACSEISSQNMKISWNSPPQHLHGGVILGYKVLYRPVYVDSFDMPITGEVKRTSSSETYLHGLYKFTNYSIRVLAFTTAGDGVMSQPLFCTTEEDLPGSPMSIKAAALTGESVLVSWLSPSKPNGRIILYTIYCREAGRVGKHTSYNMKIENMLPTGLTYQARNLREHQLYEFWVSATTSIGEGEPTSIVAQATNSRAPSRIVSFSQTLHIPDKSEVLLPCIAVGNPTPWTKWIYRDRAITFSPFYEVTGDGNLKIHSLDPSLSGNYCCIAKNLFGEDEIVYTLIAVLPPSSPALEIQFTTTSSIRLYWNHPENGGAIIKGYILNIKYDTDDWTSRELPPDHFTYTLENLKCGSPYHVYLLAHNRVGNSSPSPIQTVNTKGGPPLLPKGKEFITTNATTLQMNLYIWPDGGCPILSFSIQYKAYYDTNWILVAKSVSEERIIVHNLSPATWYQLNVSAKNDAGITNGYFSFATTTLLGEQIEMPRSFMETDASNDDYQFPYTKTNLCIILAVIIGVISTAIVGIILRKKRINRENSSPDDQNGNNQNRHHIDVKTTGRDKRNSHQLYTSSPVKSNEKLPAQTSGMYEITPYATFNLPGPNTSRSVTTSTLDYTMQFKTFGHVEDEEYNSVMYPKNIKQNTWHKKRHYIAEGQNPQKLRRVAIPLTRGDSESDDTSGSLCGECPRGTNYRVPVKPSRDLFRPNSSTESNEGSPLPERKLTPRLAEGNKHTRAKSESSSEECQVIEVGASDDLMIQPPSRFSDSGEIEPECDRIVKMTELPVELALLLTRYQDSNEEKKEFPIHV